MGLAGVYKFAEGRWGGVGGGICVFAEGRRGELGFDTFARGGAGGGL